MLLISMLKADLLDARKRKQPLRRTTLTTLVGEAVMIGKNDGNRDSNDEEVLALIVKFVNGCKDRLKYTTDDNNRQLLIDEIDILEQYLPTKLSLDELEDVLSGIVTDHNVEAHPKNIKVVMQLLSNSHPNQYDGGDASVIVKQLMGVK